MCVCVFGVGVRMCIGEQTKLAKMTCMCDLPLYADNVKPATIHVCVCVCLSADEFLPSFELCSFPFSFVFYSGIATTTVIIEIKQTHGNQIQFKR